jgi:aspartyl-tRNA(Asn)/glutamyl-tRNA(Gln) amidotransferase subunit A
MSYGGAVRNPWKNEQSAGGPCGGSAAAVAAGLCYGALASGTWPSIRLSASYCGIAGLSPTQSRISQGGLMSVGSPLPVHVGPMTRSALDAALMLDAIADYDKLVAASTELRLPRFSGMSFKRPRLGVPREQFWSSLDPEIESALNQALAQLSKQTSDTREVEIPTFAMTTRGRARRYRRR